MKKCVRCEALQPADSFYPNDATCKDCRKALVRANRKVKAEYYRAYDRARADDPDRVALRKAVAEARKKDKEILAADRKRAKAWQERNRIKRQAHIAVGNAIRDGRLIPAPCERCGFAFGIEAHHEDYSKPLDVNWLCQKCHGQRHREINEERRRAA